MFDLDALAAACRTNDNRTTLAEGDVDAVLRELDLDPSAAVYVGEQRALRVALIFEGWTNAEIAALADRMEPRRVRLNSEVIVYLPTFASIWVDGLATGLRARQ